MTRDRVCVMVDLTKLLSIPGLRGTADCSESPADCEQFGRTSIRSTVRKTWR